MATGRERAWDIVLNGEVYGIVPGQNGVPLWMVEQLPEIAGQESGVRDEIRQWRSWHSGFGWSHAIAPNTYHYATNMDARFSRQIIMGPAVTSTTCDGNVLGFFEQSSTLYVLATRYVNKLNTSTDAKVTIDGGDGSTGIDLGSGNAATAAISFDANTIVALGESDNFYSFTGTTWTQTGSPPEDVYGTYLTKFWAETYFALARSVTVSSDPSVRWISEGSALSASPSNWATAYNVGEDGRAITGLTAVDQTVYVGKTDGLYYVDKTGRTPRIVPVYMVNANNGVNLTADSSGYVWYPSVEGYLRYSPYDGSVVDCSPGKSLPNVSGIYGRVTAHAQHRGWRYVAVYDGTNSYIMCGREREPDEPGFGPYVWHGALYKLASAQITCMHVTTLTTPPRLYFGAGTGAYYFRLPNGADNPLLDSNYRYATSGSIYFPTDEWGAHGVDWALTGFELENDGFSASTYADLLVEIDDGDWITVDRANVNGRAHLYIPAAGSWKFKTVGIRLDVTNGVNTSSPKIRALVGKAVRRVRTRSTISTSVFCSDNATSRFRIPTRKSGAAQLDALENLDESEAVTLSDWWTGSKRDRRVLVGPVRESIVKQKADEPADQIAQLSMRVMDSLPTEAYYDVDNWDEFYWG